MREAEAEPHARMRRQARHVAVVEEDAAASPGRRMPATMRNAVVLPAPLGPITARNSPRSTAKVTPLAAATPPKLICRSSMRASARHAGLFDRTKPARPPGLKRITSISMAPKISSR